MLHEFHFGGAAYGWIRTDELVQTAIVLRLLCCSQRLKQQHKDRNGADRFPGRAETTHAHRLRHTVQARQKVLLRLERNVFKPLL